MTAQKNAAIKERVKAQFAATAANYVVSKGHASGDDLARMAELAAATEDDIALDIATGGGHTALAVAAKAGHVVASDFTQTMLATAREFISSKGKTNVTYALADAEALPFADHSFSLVTTRIAPHHFPDARSYVHEVARVLEPGGRFLLEDSVVPEGEAGDLLNHIETVARRLARPFRDRGGMARPARGRRIRGRQRRDLPQGARTGAVDRPRERERRRRPLRLGERFRPREAVLRPEVQPGRLGLFLQRRQGGHPRPQAGGHVLRGAKLDVDDAFVPVVAGFPACYGTDAVYLWTASIFEYVAAPRPE